MKENMKKSRKKRGMTLVEVIISIAVMAVMTLLLTTIGVTIDNYRRDTKARNSKITVESPIAEARKSSDDSVKMLNDNFKVTVNGVEIKGKFYSTGVQVDTTVDEDGNTVPVYDNGSGNLKFIYIPPKAEREGTT